MLLKVMMEILLSRSLGAASNAVCCVSKEQLKCLPDKLMQTLQFQVTNSANQLGMDL